MWLLILEALVALSILLFAVWWTMFSGRKPEAPPPAEPAEPVQPPTETRRSSGEPER
jgi:cytoskeletal protein RodZ